MNDTKQEELAIRGMAAKIEHAIYDFVVRCYGSNEAYSPSWSIPDLAVSVAKDVMNNDYVPVNELHYEWEEE